MTANLVEGMQAPAFRLPRDGGGTVSLADFTGKKLVIFFYPRANTPGCTAESKAFSARAGEFAQVETALLGISADPVKAQDAFKAKHGLTIPLACDATGEVLKAYGAWGEKSMYGKKFMGILRTTVLIDRAGRIARIWRRVKVAGHAEEVLAAAKAI